MTQLKRLIFIFVNTIYSSLNSAPYYSMLTTFHLHANNVHLFFSHLCITSLTSIQYHLSKHKKYTYQQLLRFPTKVLLEEEGIIPSGDLSTFTGIGDPTAIANLIAIRRDRDKQAQMRTIVIPNSVSVSEDGKTLFFRLSQSIDVQKPELLMEQTGVSELVRVTSAKAMLTSNDGQMMAVFASALEQDYASADGPALEESVDSFIALDQSKK